MQNYDPRVNTIMKTLLSGMQDKDRRVNIVNCKTLVHGTLFDPQFKNVSFIKSHQLQIKSDIIKLPKSIISSNKSDNEEKPMSTATLTDD
jgi:hypothetical protein